MPDGRRRPGVRGRRASGGARIAPVRTVLAMLAASLAVSACSTHPATAPAPEQASLNVGVLPTVDAAALYVAVDRGLFRAEGLTVHAVDLTTGAASIASLRDGKLDLAFGSYVTFYLAQAKGARLRIVAEGYQADPDVLSVLTAPGSSIRTPADLAGKRIAVDALDNVGTLTIDSVLRTDGVDPASVRFVVMSFPKIVSAVRSHDVDAGYLVEPFTTRAEESFGARQILDLAAGPTADFPIAGYVAAASFADTHPRTVAAFRRALRKAQALCADRRVVERELPRYTTIKPGEAAIVVIGTYPTSRNLGRLQRVADLMSQAGLLSAPFDLRTMVG